MEKYLKDAIDNFLSSEVYNRALFISGNWGSGKTYFLKNTLKQHLKSIGYEFFYISVNGIDSIPDFKKVLISKAIIGDSDKKKNAWDIVKARAQKAVKFFDKADVLFEIIEISDLIDIEKTIFCFDDIERAGSSIEINQLLGFINTELIEHKGSKVIFVGDTTKNKLIEKGFGEIKEKYVGWTIRYSTNNSEVLSSIISNFDDKKDFQYFLKKHSEFILKILETFEFKNFRTLQFLIETLRIIFEEFSNVYEEIEEEIIYITTILCYEYKNGGLHLFQNEKFLPRCITQKEELKSYYLDSSTGIFSDSPKEDKTEREKKIETFCKHFNQYTSHNGIIKFGAESLRYNFNRPIYDLITTGSFNKSKLLELLKVQKKTKIPKRPKKDRMPIFNLVQFDNLSEQEYQESYKLLASELEDGKYNIYETIQAIRYMLWASDIGLLQKSKEQIITFSNKIIDNLNIEDFDILELSDNIGIEPFSNEIKKYDSVLYDKLIQKLKQWRKDELDKKLRMDLTKDKSLLDIEKLWQALVELDGTEVSSQIFTNLTDRQYLKDLNSKLKKLIKERIFPSNSKEINDSFILILGKLKNGNKEGLDKIDNYFVEAIIKTIEKSIEETNKRNAV